MAVKSLAQSSLVEPFSTNSMLAGYSGNAFHHLETVRLSSITSIVTFSNLSRYADYQHLQLRITAKTTRTDIDVQNLLMRFNGSTSGYNGHQVRGDGTSMISTNYNSYPTAIYIYPMTGNMIASVYGSGIYDILDPFDPSKNTTVRGLDGLMGNFKFVALRSGAWFNTTPVSSISFTPDDGMPLLAGSRFSLYGIKARA